ncbi:hypothetical protein [Rhizobium leguminosarum]|uniref:hypothetical protein n=1 Tax=Rhizobium leguminosarum TaxID=384 RepID=UPI001C96E71C|nr:hypothetical protein [Rhizobium leguminosarum]MBY5812904.1 hypothetical protein [Rhizobium leguminosarum]
MQLMKTVVPVFFVGGVALIGQYVLGYSWQDCAIFGLGIAAVLLASENNDLKHEISFLRDRVESLEDKVGHQWN